MKQLLHTALFVILSLILMNCQDDDNREAVTLLLKDLAEKPQQFDISADTVVTITGQKGTRLTIDPNNLELEDGSEISADLRVELLELTTKKELLLHNAQTVSNGNWLVSGGAYNIEIFSGNEKVKLKEGKTISAEFPQISDEPMELFYGNREQNNAMNWEPTGEKFQEKKYRAFILEDYPVLDELNTKIFRVDKYKMVPKIEDLGNQTYSDIMQRTKPPKDHYRDTLFVLNDTIIAYNFYWPDLKKLPYSDYEISQAEKDSVMNIYSKRKTLDTIIKQMENPFDFERYYDQILQDSINWTPYQKKWEQNQQIYEAIELEKIGWINVDRFYPQNQERYTLTINETDDLNFLCIVDETQNTLLQLYGDDKKEVDLPKQISFEIIGFGFDENDEFFGVKKRVQLRKDRSITLKRIPLEINQVKSFLDF